MRVLRYLLSLGRSAQMSLSPCLSVSCHCPSPSLKPSHPHPPHLTAVQRLTPNWNMQETLDNIPHLPLQFPLGQMGWGCAGEGANRKCPGSSEGWLSREQSEIISPASNLRARRRQVPQERFFCLFSSGLTSNQRI